jgi:succinyl-CoA synthetase beta subunit
MNLHEYQGKEIFAKYDLPVSKGKVVTSLDEVAQACTDIGGTRWVAKAQVHAGGRGKSGGVALCDTIAEVRILQKNGLVKDL